MPVSVAAIPLRIALAVIAGLLIQIGAGESPHGQEHALRPIAELLPKLKLDALAALPVQQGGRYKALYAHGMEIVDALNGTKTLATGHTPLSALLDLVFCRQAYLNQRIVVIKHIEVRRDLAASIKVDGAALAVDHARFHIDEKDFRKPDGSIDQAALDTARARATGDLKSARDKAALTRATAEAAAEEDRKALRESGRITPNRLNEATFITAIEELGRFTSKNKSLGQIHRARATIDPSRLVGDLALFALPSGPDSSYWPDHWRAPTEVAPDLEVALARYLDLARSRSSTAFDAALDAYANLTWTALPLPPEAAMRLRLTRDENELVNRIGLWPLWKAAGAGKVADAALLVRDPAAAAKAIGLGAEEADGVAQAITVLREKWPSLRIAASDFADPAQRGAIDAAFERAWLAWNDLGAAWSDQRLAARTAPGEAALQGRIDALVAASATLRELHAAELTKRGKAVPTLSTELELTYWRWNAFSWVAYLFLIAVPLLALGSIGRLRLPLMLGLALFGLGVLGQLAAFFMRWELAQRIPLSNLYESMAFAALLSSLLAIVGEVVLASMRTRPALAAAGAVGGMAAGATPPAVAGTLRMHGALALAAALFGMLIVLAQAFLEVHDINAFISPAMPILSEFWLRVHTSCIVSSYGIIALAGLMSLVYLLMRIWLRWDDPRCLAWDRTNFAINALAMIVLWVGLCLGAVWAAVSWGRPWGWDPKEVFALLTWVVFIALVHLRLAVRPQHRGAATAWVALFAMVVMVFNWYWVNVRLAGLHSYA